MGKSKSEGLAPNMEQTMTVTQDGDTINVQTRIVSQKDSQTITDSYVIDEQKKQFVPQAPNGMNGQDAQTIKWLEGGMAFKIDEESPFDTPKGPASGRITRK